MKPILSALLPSSLVGRVFSLYVASLMSFVVLGAAVFYKYQFSREIDDHVAAADVMMNVAAQSVADSAVVGDYDSITKTLERSITGSHFSQAQFIDTQGGKLKVSRQAKGFMAAPQWFQRVVQAKLDHVNQNVAVGGKDYGVLRLSFATDEVAGNLWRQAWVVLAMALGSVLFGALIIRSPLKRWLGNFDRVRSHERLILSGASDIDALLDQDAPLEVRQVFDILKRAAGRLDAQRAEATVTLNAITDGVLTTDVHHRVVYVNPAAEVMLGSDAQTLIGQDVRSLLPSVFPKEQDDIGWSMKRVELPSAKAGAQNGTAILDITVSSILSGAQTWVGLVLAFRDVTEQHTLDQQLRTEFGVKQRALESLQKILNTFQRTEVAPPQVQGDLDVLIASVQALVNERETVEAQLAEQLNFVEVLLEATPTPIYLKDRAGRYLRFNRAFEDLFGIVRSEWFGKNVFDMVQGEAANLMHQKDLDLFEFGEVQTYEASFANRKTGAVREGLYWKAPLTNERGEITGLVGTILDVTERNRVHEELRQAKTLAEVANKAKSDFLANMSHEIRTPMNGVIGMTDLALDTPLTEIQREYLSVVKSSAQALMVILNDILDFSKIEAGKMQVENVAFSPATVVQDTLKAVTARAEKKGLTVHCAMDADLPSIVLGDPGRIRQVLTNLCDNAIKFTNHGSLTVEARRGRLSNHQYELLLSVRDTGIGIPENKLGTIFGAFNQADTSTTREYGGTGLGLTICARLVELMGGKIWVKSEPGQGSTFLFTVRLLAGDAEVLAGPPPAPPVLLDRPAVGLPAPKRLRVLLVEDNLVNQKLATVLLAKWGHDCTLAQNGQEAVNLFPTQEWDLILMDMQMPIMGGLEATRRIRAQESAGHRTPILAMTANAMESDRQACLDAGMDDHLSKPLHAKALQACIEKHTSPTALSVA